MNQGPELLGAQSYNRSYMHDKMTETESDTLAQCTDDFP